MASAPSVPTLALIGCGNFARRQHLPNLCDWEGVILSAVCDREIQVARECAEAFGVEMATDSVEALLIDPRLDAVVIAVPDAMQADLTLAACKAGKHVYVEKPVAGSAAAFDRLISARDQSGSQVAVGFNKRFSPAYMFVRQHLQSAGSPLGLYLRMADDAWRWGAHLPEGSLLRHDACHLFDLATWLTGEPVSSIMAVGTVPNEHSVLLTHRNGMVSTVTLSGNASMDFPKERMEAITNHGSITMDDFVEVRVFGNSASEPAQTFTGMAARPEDVPWVEKLGTRGIAGMMEIRRELFMEWQASGKPVPDVIPNFLRDQGWRKSIRTFVDCISGKHPLPHATLEDAKAVAAITNAVEESLGSGTSVALTD